MEKRNQRKFAKEIEDLHRLHYIAKTYDHLIGEYKKETYKDNIWKRDSWTLFEPTKFVYAYFAFNSFYNFDWGKSLENKKLTLSNKNKERNKYQDMIDYIFSRVNEEDKDSFLEMIKGDYDINDIYNTINKIKPDNRINDKIIDDFKESIKNLLGTNKVKIGQLKNKLKNDIIHFIYMVRNNIFHGTKNTIDMYEESQRKRLNIYSNIIIAINELLFKVLAKELIKANVRFYFMENYELVTH
ncbi:hypothetical protein [Globicatella sulfidifaciens]|uniref:Apea-like HEPN domain-containing protein n=1 Tax=Globicatella sulfidifaciens TaxID=136093 RepID=A0A7X8C214_9LACT|nr:hypothetical protein [Globicatella sulfidifaciens]NLJ17567.1 hypothetical protein [Globicatella sulfidifaciens]